MVDISATLVTLAILCYVVYQLARTNMTVSENVERKLSEREAIRFAISNDLPLH